MSACVYFMFSGSLTRSMAHWVHSHPPPQVEIVLGSIGMVAVGAAQSAHLCLLLVIVECLLCRTHALRAHVGSVLADAPIADAERVQFEWNRGHCYAGSGGTAFVCRCLR